MNQNTKNLVNLIPTSCYIFFRTHAMSLYVIETRFMKLHKKYLKNISVVFHERTNCIYGCKSFDGNHECLEYARSRFLKHFNVEILFALIQDVSPQKPISFYP